MNFIWAGLNVDNGQLNPVLACFEINLKIMLEKLKIWVSEQVPKSVGEGQNLSNYLWKKEGESMEPLSVVIMDDKQIKSAIYFSQ